MTINKLPKRVELHSTSSHGSPAMFTMIDYAIRLMNFKGSSVEVEIVLHPIIKFYTPRTIFIGLWRQAKARLKKLRNLQLRRVSESQKVSGSAESLDAGQSIFRLVYSSGAPVRISTPKGDIVIRRNVRRRLESFRSFFVAYFRSGLLWRKCYEHGLFQPLRYLQLEYAGIRVGDLAASTALREDGNAGGALRRCQYLRRALLNAVAINDYIQNINLDIHDWVYVSVPEPTYLHAIYERQLHLRGAKILDGRGMHVQHPVNSFGELQFNRFVMQVECASSLSGEERDRAIKYLQERIELPRKHLSYMNIGINSRDMGLWDSDGRPLEMAVDGLCAVIFLHSFDDASYYFGTDGFEDIFDWTVFTVDNLIKSADVETVLIKEHPNVNYAAYPGDKVAKKRLSQRYYRHPKVHWLRRDVGPVALAQYKNLVGITHHGSVAEELAFLGIPVVASTHAPWGHSFDFVKTWTTPKEYLFILKSLKTHALFSVANLTKEPPESLLRFVLIYRIEYLHDFEIPTWRKFMHFCYGSLPDDTPQNHEEATRRLEDFSLDSTNLRDFIAFLACYNEHSIAEAGSDCSVD